MSNQQFISLCELSSYDPFSLEGWQLFYARPTTEEACRFWGAEI